LRDHVTFRIFNASTNQQHVHHQHAHQWVHTANDDSSTYLDSQLIVPGSAYTLDMVYNGSGNRNGTIGDSIFHCHFYPHFAAGMWSLWRRFRHQLYDDPWLHRAVLIMGPSGFLAVLAGWYTATPSLY
jgi:hypothetical protein